MNRDFEFRKKRDFNGLLTGTFSFFKQEFTRFMKGFLPLFLPLMLVTGLINSQLDLSGNNLVNDIVYNLVYTVYIFFIMAYTYAYIVLYTPNEAPDNRSVRTKAFRLYFAYYPAKSITWAFLTVFVVTFSANWVSSNSLMEFLVICGFWILWLIYSIRFSLSFIIIAGEKAGTVRAFVRSSNLMRRFWWSSFWACFIIMFICFIASEFFNLILVYVRSELFDRHNYVTAMRVFMILSLCIQLLGMFVGAMLVSIFSSLNYFNLVERKEAPDLIERIGKLQSESTGTNN